MGARLIRERRLGDRRRELRFEIVGDLWATLELRPTFRLLNLGEGGALVESRHPLPAGAQCAVRLTAGERTSVIPVTVRHVTPPDGSTQMFRIGLEFADLPGDVRGHLDALLGAAEPAPTWSVS